MKVDNLNSSGFWIEIKQLKCSGRVGIHSHEIVAAQEIWADVALFLTQDVASIKKISQTVDYQSVSELFEKIFLTRHFPLVEEVIADAAALIFQSYPLVQEIDLKITKPHALKNAAPSVRAILKRNNSKD